MPDGNYDPAADLTPVYQSAGQKYGIDPDLLRAQTRVESSDNPYAVSSAGAEGMSQFIPSTAATEGLKDPYDPHESIPAQAKLLRENANKYGSMTAAIGAYHSGTGDPSKWGPATNAYLDSMNAEYARMKQAAPPPQEQQEQQPSITDQINTARKAGYNDGEIASYLQQSKAWAPKFDEARKAGYLDDEVLQHFGLKVQPGAPLTNKQAVKQLPMAQTEEQAPLPAQQPVPANTPQQWQWNMPSGAQAVAQAGAPPPPAAMPAPQASGEPTPQAPTQPAPGLRERYANANMAIGNAIVDAWNNSPGLLTPWAQGMLNKTGLGGVTMLADTLFNSGPSAVFAGGLEALNQIGGRHLAEIGESVMTQTMGEAGAQHADEGIPAVRNEQPAAAPVAERTPPADTAPPAAAQAAPAAPAVQPDMPMLARKAAQAQRDLEATPAAETGSPTAVPTMETPAPAAPVPPQPSGRPLEEEALAELDEVPQQGPPEPAAAEAHQELEQIAEGKPATTAAPVGNVSEGQSQATLPEPSPPEGQPLTPEPVAQPPASTPEPTPLQQRHAEVSAAEAERSRADEQGTLPTIDVTPKPEQRGKQPTPFEPTPKEPQRLIDFLRSKTILAPGTIHEQVIPGGIRDTGGDLRAILGGSKGRPGLINNASGMSLHDKLIQAWFEGYFPELGEEPPTDDGMLLDAIRDDHTGSARYSIHDQDAADAYRAATEGNSEIDRLAAEHGIETRGKTRDQFFDELHDNMSLADREREIASQDADHEAAYREAEKQAKQWVAENQGQGWNAKELYGISQARTLEDLEREYAEEAQPHPTAAAPGERAAGEPEHGPPGRDQGAVPEGGESRGSGAGDAARVAEANDQGTDLLGRQVAEPRAKAQPEPTIHNDTRQDAMPGMESSAVQAQAARDAQGRGALQADVAQKPADEGLFAPDTSGQGTLYAGPGAVFDPQAWRRAFGPFAPAAIRAVSWAKKGSDKIANGLAPMRSGSVRAQAWATDFANSLRQVNFHYGEIDREIERRYKPSERAAMGAAMDAQSVFEQQVRDMPADQQGAARAQFDAGATGIAGLRPDQQRVLRMLDTVSQGVWERMRERGMVSPQARGLPFYFPRQILTWSEENGFERPGGGGQGAGRNIEPVGGNLTTQGPMRREHLTPEETEAAAQSKFGPGAAILTDIRMLPSRLAQAERAIAGSDLMSQIERVGNETGVNLVTRGDIPGLLNPADYFTIEQHPAFRQFTGTGWKAIHVSKEFEGPLRAVLTKSSGDLYRGAMALKSGVMSAIMYSPFIHLAVELGRSLPVMPLRVLSLQALRDGSRLRADMDYMDRATTDGLAPLGRSGWRTDPISLADQANDQGGNRFVRAIKEMRDNVARGAGAVLGQTAQDIIQHPHQTLLWDQVFNLQVGLYDGMRNKWIEKGYPPEVAGQMAAHIANRYAGALPPEHLARGANMAANMLLFSRSFTLGNLGVMKDMLTGAPGHLVSRLQQMAGPEMAASAQSAMRRKAIAAFTMDIGMFYLANGLLQSGLQVMRNASAQGGVGPAAQQMFNSWYDEATSAISGAGNNPLSIFGVLPQHWNEPGKQDRVFAGTDDQQRGIYLRLPAGKVGEEFLGWFAKPGTMLVNKASPLVRPIIEDAIGYDSLGRGIYKPDPQTMMDYIGNVGRAVQHIATNLGPTSTIEGGIEEFRHHVLGEPAKGDQGVSALKLLGPMTGLAQVSSGFPGGPAAGEMHAQSEREKFDLQQAMPAIREKIKAGDTEGAVADMTALNVPPALRRYYLRQTVQPGPSKGALRRLPNAPADVQERVRRQLGQQP